MTEFESALIPLPSRRATLRLARQLAGLLRSGDLLILSGSLGAGKTFFTRGLLRELGVPQRERVTSPTFSLVHEYEAKLSVRHADLYRLEDASELEQLGLDEARRNGALLVVEWGEPYADALGGDALLVALTVDREGKRSASLRGTAARAQALATSILRGAAGAPL